MNKAICERCRTMRPLLDADKGKTIHELYAMGAISVDRLACLFLLDTFGRSQEPPAWCAYKMEHIVCQEVDGAAEVA